MMKGHGLWLSCEWCEWTRFVDDRDPPDRLAAVAGQLAQHVDDEHPSVQRRSAVCADCGRYFEGSPDAGALQHMLHHSVAEHGPRTGGRPGGAG